MALKRKLKNGLVQLRSIISTSAGTTRTEVERWSGPYGQLVTKQKALELGAKTTNLEPTEAGEGLLTVTRESTLSEFTKNPSRVETEVDWQALEQEPWMAPVFAELTPAQIKRARDEAEKEGDASLDPAVPLAGKLYEKIVKGIKYVSGVPVVRRTTTSVRGDLAGGNAWFRDNPPVDVDGDWEFVKTADSRVKDGTSFTQVEEWTGAEEWDEDFFPTAEEE